MDRGSWRRWHGQATAERPLPSHPFQGSHFTVISQLLLALGFGRVPHGRRCPVEYPAVLTQRQMAALTTREQEARRSPFGLVVRFHDSLSCDVCGRGADGDLPITDVLLRSAAASPNRHPQ